LRQLRVTPQGLRVRVMGEHLAARRLDFSAAELLNCRIDSQSVACGRRLRPWR